MELNDFIKELNEQIRQNNQKNKEKRVKNTGKRRAYLTMSILTFPSFIMSFLLLIILKNQNQIINEYKELIVVFLFSISVILFIHLFSEYQGLRYDEETELRITFDELCQKKVNFPDSYLEKIYEEFEGGVITLRKLKNLLIQLRNKDEAIKKLSVS